MNKKIIFLIMGIFLLVSFSNLVLAAEMCPRPVDVVIVSDISESSFPMIDELQSSAKYFIDLFNPSLSLMGLVSFEYRGTVDSVLTNNFLFLKDIIDSYVASGQTNLEDGLQKAYNVFFNSAVINPNEDFMVLVTDGEITHYTDDSGNVVHCSFIFPSECSTQALLTALKAKNNGVEIYVIGLEVTNPDVEQFLISISSGPSYYFNAASSDDLEAIYLKISQEICVQLDADLFVWDDSDNEEIFEDDEINFYADYTAEDNGESISTGSCRIAFDLGSGYGNFTNMTSSYLMNYNSALEVFEYSDSFSDAGDYGFKIICEDSVYENLEEESEFEILEEESEEENENTNHFVQTCNPNWECSGWSGCVDEMKSRECVDLNDCEFSYNEPSERTGCLMLTGDEVLVNDLDFDWLFLILVGLAVLLILVLIFFSLRV